MSPRPATSLLAAVASACAALLVAATPLGAFEFADVVARAQKLAAAPFQPPGEQIPDWLKSITYDQWRDIRFRPERALWRDRRVPFQVQFFHLGMMYDRPIAVHVVESDGVHPVPFSPSQFDYGKNDFASRVPQDLGYAGFRVHYPIKRTDYFDEVIVFLGASYFRAVGRDQTFGLSARALAIDTALSSGEEFPYFKEFWLVSPAPAASEMILYALLDSPSVAGAYKFVVDPGEQTLVGVDLELFFRREVQKLGIAPLTSMFFHGENTIREIVDYRPEVHDSDGLLIDAKSGEWLWRPLDNPRALHVTGHQGESPRGFGLLQRDREFAHYQDLETRPDLRPSAWIVPRGDWGDGQVELVEIPTNSDANDNIATYWVPRARLKAGDPTAFGYTIAWYGDDAGRPPGGRTVATRRDFGNVDNVHRFVLDFAGKRLAALPPETVLHGAITVQGEEKGAELVDQQVVKNELTGEWRVTFQVRPQRRAPIDVRAFLDRGGDALSETWSYVVLP